MLEVNPFDIPMWLVKIIEKVLLNTTGNCSRPLLYSWKAKVIKRKIYEFDKVSFTNLGWWNLLEHDSDQPLRVFDCQINNSIVHVGSRAKQGHNGKMCLCGQSSVTKHVQTQKNVWWHFNGYQISLVLAKWMIIAAWSIGWQDRIKNDIDISQD